MFNAKIPEFTQITTTNITAKIKFSSHHQYLLSEQCEPQILFKYFAFANLVFKTLHNLTEKEMDLWTFMLRVLSWVKCGFSSSSLEWRDMICLKILNNILCNVCPWASMLVSPFIRRPEGNLEKLAPSYNHMDSRGWILIVRLRRKHLYPLSHCASLCDNVFCKANHINQASKLRNKTKITERCAFSTCYRNKALSYTMAFHRKLDFRFVRCLCKGF